MGAEKGAFLRVHHFLTSSRSNGPGERAVVWVQGCTLGCPGCFNPETHSAQGGSYQAVADLVARLQELPAEVTGLTISGGEPLQQLPALRQFLRGVRTHTKLSILLFSGFTWEEIQRLPGGLELLGDLDILIAGRYDPNQRLAQGLRGSANKTVHFLTSRYTPADLLALPEAEVWLTPEGHLIFSGIDPLQWD